MRKIAETDIEELYALAPGENSAPQHLRHLLASFDERGELLVRLVTAWGHMAIFADTMHDLHTTGNPMEQTPALKRTITDTVLRAALTVDAIWDEAQRRGWVITAPSMDK